MADLDRLEVQVEASTAKANAELNKLVNKLDKVASSLSSINSSGLIGFANGIEKLGKSMQTMNAVKTSDFSRLARNIQKLSTLNTAGLSTASSAFILFGKSLASFGAASKSAENIAVMVKNISKLGGKSVHNAIDNMPRLATALKKLMTTLAQAPNVSNNVIQMTRALADLGNALKGAQNGGTSNAGNNGAGNVNKLSAAFSRLSGNITKSGRSMKNFAQIAGRFYANCWLIIRTIKKMGNAISAAMDYVETYNYFAVTMDKIGSEFGGMYAQYGYDSAEEYAKSFSDRMNELTRKMTGYKVGESGELTLSDSIGLALDPEAVMNYQSSIAAVTNSVGLLGENSVNVSKALTMLSADLSSLKNVELETVMNNLQSGLIGQSRALYKYGIDITNATLQTYAYKFGLSKAVSEMTQGEKMQLRMIAILDQSKIAWGDQANTINSVANQYRIMKQQLSNLARVIGNLFLPILQKVLPVVNGLIIALQRLFTTLGFKLWGDSWLKDTMDGISGSYADDSLGEMEDDADGFADGLEEADKKAKKLAATLLGFDEINKLSDNTDDASGKDKDGLDGNLGQIDLSGAIADALADYEAVWEKALADAKNKAQEYADIFTEMFRKIGDGKLGQMLTNAMNSINWDAIYESARNFGTGLASFLNSLISPELFGAVGRTIASALNTAIYAALSFGTTFDWANLGLSIAAGVNEFFRTFDFKALAGTINVWVKGLLDSIITAMSNIDWALIGRQIGIFLAELDFLEIGAKVGRLIWEAIKAGITVWKNSFSAAPIETTIISALLLLKFTGLGKLLAGKIAVVLSTAFTETSVVTILAKGLQALLGNATAAVSFSNPFAAGIAGMGKMNPMAVTITGIGTALAGVTIAVSNFFEMWKNGFSWLNEAFMLLGIGIAAVGAVILGVPAGIAAAVAGVVAAVATVAVVIHDNWDSICSWITEKWESVKSLLSSGWNFIKSAAAAGLDGIRTAASNAFNKIEKTVSSAWNTIKTSTSTVWNNIKSTLSTGWNVLKSNATTVFGGIKTTVSTEWNTIKATTATVWNGVKANLSTGWTALKTNASTAFSGIKSTVSSAWEVTKTTTSSTWGSIKSNMSSTWNNLKTSASNTFNNIKEAISRAWRGVNTDSDANWRQVEKTIKAPINNIIKMVNNMISGVATQMNKFIKMLNKIKIPKWVPGIGGKGINISTISNIPQIPAFAQGGYPETGQLFLARENGINEMIGRIGNRSAVANNDQIVEAVSSGVAGAMADVMMAFMGQSSDGAAPILEFTFKTDNETLYRAVLKGKEKHDRRWHVAAEI